MELVGGHFFHWREDRQHRVVDPDIDRPELLLDGCRCLLDLRGVGDVEWQRQRPPAGRLDLTTRAFQSFLAACDQADRCTTLREGLCRRAPDARRCAGDDDDLRFVRSIHRVLLNRSGAEARPIAHHMLCHG
jgi:hypothetical protein